MSHSKYAVDNNLPLVYGIEGLIDEVMIYDRALTAAEIGLSFQASCPPEAELSRPDLEKSILPGGGASAGPRPSSGRPARL
ncbi:MAG: LamG domain-containing protein [Comamonadaceae bacterium]|nr:LamG domain-containing protein [Comamonadaceae bacterium]